MFLEKYIKFVKTAYLNIHRIAIIGHIAGQRIEVIYANS